MVTSCYVQNRRELIWLNFDSQAGHEQAGRRPALVLSLRAYNERSGMVFVCPITSRIRGYSFEVKLPAGHPIAGVILADRLKSMDWNARNAEPAGEVPSSVLKEVEARLAPLLGWQ